MKQIIDTPELARLIYNVNPDDDKTYEAVVSYFATQMGIATQQKDEEILSLHRQLATERLRADQGWERYMSANADRNAVRQLLMKLNNGQRFAIIMSNETTGN